ncbi:MAG: DUF262 domain-containing HNH endonuclease family protein [Lamprobacter sp.]|uniref:DUF262 domain-containing protein n=1 Tax=Lamprobacter sp. TaxID=3100796 RepID=UPI002B25FD39|nr:DUF262 domain-containing HNH endonuclease family protein [Lamprobacter sp.]MEA3642097.1 DUF262 domain-containing HNH endonuclease family protein [Lamprobacter sp.]
MSSQQTLKQFFSGKLLDIPRYQRSYAWEKQNVSELFEDIKEAIETNSQHYLGTIVLAKTDNPEIYTVVDGQQRLTTLLLFIACVIRKLPEEADRTFFHRTYIKEQSRYKLIPLERDRDFYFQLLDMGAVDVGNLAPENKSQKFLLDAFDEVENLAKYHIKKPDVFLSSIEKLSVLEFIEKDESDAIRIFQTVNDRGKELSRMDKMKSLLFYFSDKYLGRKYDDDINNGFADIFTWYDEIKLIAERKAINIISSKQFTEDDLLRHHHICFSDESYDPTSHEVQENVKNHLYKIRKDKNSARQLDQYISRYLKSLVGYVNAFRNIIVKVNQYPEYYKLFSIQGLNIVLYPVITQLEKNSFLDQVLPTRNITIQKMLSIIDLRLFKLRAYQGRKHAAEFAYSLNTKDWDLKDIENQLNWLNRFEISDSRFKDYLENYDYYSQTGMLRSLFIDYSERLKNKAYSIKELESLMASNPTIEHILSKTPNFKPRALGFKNDQDFEEYQNLLGNLTILEKKINSSIQNSNISGKTAAYKKSKFKMTSELGTDLAVNPGFNKKTMLDRGKKLSDKFAQWWPE